MYDPARQNLRSSLRRATPIELLTLLREGVSGFSAGDAIAVLRNPLVTADVIDELAHARSLLTSYEVRCAIARHRRTSEITGLRFIPDLFWRDLLEISVDMRVRPSVRVVSERYLIERLERLTAGEKTTLARRATPPVLAGIRRDPDVRVIKALLTNPRLTEPVLLPLAGNESCSPRILDAVASDPKWGRRYEIKAALSLNSQAPFRVILAILPTLRQRDLLAVREHEPHSWIVKHRARELMSDRFGGGLQD